MKALPTNNDVPEVKVAVADYGQTGSHMLTITLGLAILIALCFVASWALPFFDAPNQETVKAREAVEALATSLDADIQRLQERRKALDEVLKLSTADTINAVVRHEKEALLGYKLTSVKDVSTLAVAPLPYAKLTEAPPHKAQGKLKLGIH
jgi:hypothetical protein